MKYESQIDDELLQNLLYRTETAESHTASDEADELFALLIEKGELDDHDREQFLRCLDTSSTARLSVGRYMRYAAANPESIEAPRVPVTAPCAPATAPGRFQQWLADSVKGLQKRLAGIAGSRSSQSYQPRAVGGGRGSTAWARPYAFQAALASAMLLFVATIGVVWLTWQSASGIPLLAVRGGPNLMDYGYEPSAIAIKGDGSQPGPDLRPVFDTLPAEDRQHIEKGFSYLRTNELNEAQAEFEWTFTTATGKYYAQLGKAMALYMDNRIKEAEPAFHSALELENNSVSAKIGLAMTLGRLDRKAESLLLWEQTANDDKLPEEQLAMIKGEIKRLTRKNAN